MSILEEVENTEPLSRILCAMVSIKNNTPIKKQL